jgi:hypothetical protein
MNKQIDKHTAPSNRFIISFPFNPFLKGLIEYDFATFDLHCNKNNFLQFSRLRVQIKKLFLLQCKSNVAKPYSINPLSVKRENCILYSYY